MINLRLDKVLDDYAEKIIEKHKLERTVYNTEETNIEDVMNIDSLKIKKLETEIFFIKKIFSDYIN